MEANLIKGHLIILMAPMGSGKGTLIRRVKEKHPELYDTVSCTTREKRPGEIEGDHYYFLTKEEFDQKIEEEAFYEWAVFGKNKYGTLKSEIVPNLTGCRVVICEIELQGVEQLVSLLPRENITIIYLDAGGWDIMKDRALARAPMSDEELESRHERYLIEKEAKTMADLVIDNSASTIDPAVQEFSDVIDASYKKCNI